MAKNAEIWRTALQVIQECGRDSNPKAFAFSKSSEMHASGDTEEAIRWAEIANAIDAVLEGFEDHSSIPTAVH